MKVDCRNIVRTLLCTGLLVSGGPLSHAQEPSSQQAPPATDNTKTNKRDRNANEPTADQQKENRSDRDITQQIRQSIIKTNHSPRTPTTSKSSLRMEPLP